MLLERKEIYVYLKMEKLSASKKQMIITSVWKNMVIKKSEFFICCKNIINLINGDRERNY